MINKKWTAEDIQDQKGRVVIVTGSSSGIGYEAARVLANKNATIIIAVRNMEKGKAAANRIKKQNSSADLLIMELDLANLKSVKTFAEKFNSEFERLDLLINNAGVMMPPYTKTVDGFELQFGTNHLGHFALTSLLFERLNSTPDSRIVTVSSMAHKYADFDFSDLNWEKRKYKKMGSYGASKISNLFFTYELKDWLHKSGSKVKATAAHPGWTATDLQRHSGLFEFMNGIFAQSVEMGALPTLRAAADESAESGDYFGPSGWHQWKGFPKKVESNKFSHDKNAAQKLWEISENMTGIKFQ
ncbi:MAG: oxidoreductase [Bacteroidota bacterium]